MTRPIVLPELPWLEAHSGPCGRSAFYDEDMRAYATKAVEADRKSITVTDEDIVRSYHDSWSGTSVEHAVRIALESYAKRLRGEV